MLAGLDVCFVMRTPSAGFDRQQWPAETEHWRKMGCIVAGENTHKGDFKRSTGTVRKAVGRNGYFERNNGRGGTNQGEKTHLKLASRNTTFNNDKPVIEFIFKQNISIEDFLATSDIIDCQKKLSGFIAFSYFEII